MSRIFRGGVSRLIEGVDRFQNRVFGSKKSLFGRLGSGQSPLALFITCSDSRINPNLLTQTEPGELFILRNAGNLIPHSSVSLVSGEAATVEYALTQLKVRDIVVCGHSHCGAIGGLITPHAVDHLPAVKGWLVHASSVVPWLDEKKISQGERLIRAIERNVLVQIENLKSHPAVQTAFAENRLRIHAWVYHFETGSVTAYDAVKDTFVPLAEAARQNWTSAATPTGLGNSI